MSLKGKITVTSGPDRGKSVDLTDEMVRVGKGEGNQLILSDATAADFHLNILQREGRFAVSTQATEGITVEGNPVPPDRWVWLPNLALIQLTRRTALEFQCEADPDGAPAPAASPDTSTTTFPLNPQTATSPAATTTSSTSTVFPKPRKVPAPIPMPAPASASATENATLTSSNPTDGTNSGDKLRRKKAGSSEKQDRKSVTAKFITDGPGDPLVKLGEDGHLPELQLEDGKKRPGVQQEAKKTNPVWLVLILSIAFGLSALMLFIDFENLGSSAHEKAAARGELVSYYAEGEGTIATYQVHLRQAQRARSRRDYTGEKAEYRKVLQMLRAEGKNPYTGVTGSEARDKKLEELMGILLKD